MRSLFVQLSAARPFVFSTGSAQRRIAHQHRSLCDASFGVEQSAAGGTSMPKAAFYAVAAGRKPGIYHTWPEAESQVKGFVGARHKKFKTEADARSFLAEKGTAPGPVFTPYARQTRSPSPMTTAQIDKLPLHLQAIAKQGYTFTDPPSPRLVVYTDGSSLGNGRSGATAGAGVYWGEAGASKHNIAERVPGPVQTNNRGELLSIIRAIEKCPYPALPLEVRTDSMYSISCMTKYLPGWMKNGWQTSSGPVKNTDMIRHLLVLLRRRAAPVKFKYVRGHAGHAGNEAADGLARNGAVMAACTRTDWLDPDIDETDVGKADVPVEIDPDWLMSPEEVAELEKSL